MTTVHAAGTNPTDAVDVCSFRQAPKLRIRPFLSVEPKKVRRTAQRMPDGPGSIGNDEQTSPPCTMWAMQDVDSQYEAIMASCALCHNLPGSAVVEIVPCTDGSSPHQWTGSTTESETSKCSTVKYSSNLARCLSKMVTANNTRSSSSGIVSTMPENPQQPDQAFCSSPIGTQVLEDLRSSLLPFPNEDVRGLWEKEEGRLYEWGETRPESPLNSRKFASYVTTTCYSHKGSPVSEGSPRRLPLWGGVLEGCSQSRSMPNTPVMRNSSRCNRLAAQARQTRAQISFVERALKTLKRKDSKNRARARWVHATWWASQEAQRKANHLDMLAQHVISHTETAQKCKSSQDAIFPSYIRMCNMRAVQAVVVVCSLFLVFGMDVYFSAGPPPHLDTAMYSAHTFCWCVLAVELIIRMLQQRMYLLSFFFLLDMGALVTTLPEVIWFITGVNFVRGTTLISIVRGARAVRLSTKLARLLSALHVCAAEKRSHHAATFTTQNIRRHASDGMQ
jgi:hypothetical protein